MYFRILCKFYYKYFLYNSWLPTPSKPTPTPAKPNWAPNTSYTTGQIVTYNGSNYSCVQSHSSIIT